MGYGGFVGAKRSGIGFMFQAILSVLCAGIFMGGCREAEPEPEPPVPVEEIMPVAEPKPTGYVASLPEFIFKNLLYGYSLEECIELLGRPEDAMESEYDPGTGEYGEPSLTVWRTWRFEDGSVLRLGFVSGALRDKAFATSEADAAPSEADATDEQGRLDG